jgi:hypothetical protein
MYRVLWSLLLLASLATGAARAGVSYQYVGVPSNNSVAVNGTITVSIYLNETITSATGGGAMNQSIIGLDGGLVGAAFFVTSASAQDAKITTLANNVAGSANGTNFDTQNASKVTTTQAGLFESVTKTSNFAGASFSTNAVTGTTVVNQIFLGTLTIQGVAVGSTNYTVEATKSAPAGFPGANSLSDTVTAGLDSDWNTFGSGVQLDQTNSTGTGGPPPVFTGAFGDPFTFTITTTPAVPEPSSMFLCGLAVCGGAIGAYRRRKAILTHKLPDGLNVSMADPSRLLP